MVHEVSSPPRTTASGNERAGVPGDEPGLPTRHGAIAATRSDPADEERRRAALIAAIRSELPELKLLTDPIDRESYRRDETAYLDAGLPLAVALPADGSRRRRRSSGSPRASASPSSARRRHRASPAARPASRAR